MERLAALWNRDANGKGAIVAGGLFVLVTLAAIVGSMAGGSPSPSQAPAAVATRPSERTAATEPPRPTTAARDASTEQPPTATAEPATEEPTDEPEPTGLPTVIKEPTVLEPPMPPIEPPLPTAPPSQGQGLMSAPQQPAAQAPSDGCVDINTAGFDDLRRIIDVDQDYANQIIALRAQRPFRSVDELTRVNGIGKGRLKHIKEQGLACVR